MKQFKTIVLLLFFFQLTALYSVHNLSRIDLNSFNSQYVGTFNGKPIVLYLKESANGLEGVYLLDSIGTVYHLKGEKNNTGNYIVSETNDSGKYTGTWEISSIDETLSGVWENPLSEQNAFEFSLKRMAGDIEQEHNRRVEMGENKRLFSLYMIGAVILSVVFLLMFLVWMKRKI